VAACSITAHASPSESHFEIPARSAQSRMPAMSREAQRKSAAMVDTLKEARAHNPLARRRTIENFCVVLCSVVICSAIRL
jgi:hypothetical protein